MQRPSLGMTGAIGKSLEQYRGQDLSLAGFRLALLLVAVILIAVSGNFPRLLPAVLAMSVISLVASLPLRFNRSPAAALAEGMAVAAVTTIPEPASGNLMLCLLAPGLVAGIRGSYGWVVATGAASALVGIGLILRTGSEFDRGSLIELFQWSLLAVALGTMVSWYQLQRETDDSATRSYAEAVRVLTELETISRRLPTGLDVGTIALQSLMEALSTAEAERGVLVTVNSTGRLEAAASHPEPTTDWVQGRDAWREWAALAAKGDPVQRRSRGGVTVMAPLRVDGRLIGYSLTQSSEALESSRLDELSEAMGRNALPLEAALLFSGIRDIATNEERSRIAREIHDGIAQDIAFLGYQADEIVDVAKDPAVHRLAAALRSEITRVVGELRMSVFTLREGVSQSESLGGALAGHARRIFEDSATQLHLTIEESPNRLRPEVESELLRMGQEALTNTRRHAKARNVWVTCLVDAPAATLSVEDDGVGVGDKRPDSYGLEIMRERAVRIHAELRVNHRTGGGTSVEVSI